MPIDPGTAALIAGGGELASGVFGGLLGSSAEGRRREEREAIRRRIQQMIQFLLQRGQPGIQSQGQQELAIRQQRRALQPTFQALAGRLAGGIGLEQPVAQRALAASVLGQESGQRFQMGQQNLQRVFQTEQQLRQLLTRLTSSLPSG